MTSVLKPRINPQFNRVGNLKGVAGFKKQLELYPYKNRSKSPTLSTLSFNRLYNSNVNVITISLALWGLRKQQEEHQLTAEVGYFND